MSKVYVLPAIILLFTELAIGLFVHDDLIRPFAGDLLVVLLLYCTTKIFARMTTIITAVAVLLFAYAVEISQYFHFIYRLGWQHAILARLLLGTTFSMTDMVVYSLGFIVIIIAEYIRSGKQAFKL